jgi:MFS family permease
MKFKHLAPLFICLLIGYAICNGLIALLPNYFTDTLRAGSFESGAALFFSYLALAGSGLSVRFLPRLKWPLCVASLLIAPTLWAMARADVFWQAGILTVALWFFAGMSFMLIITTANQLCPAESRGLVFGALAMASPIGSLISGLTFGAVAERHGYDTLFFALASAALLMPLCAIFAANVAHKPELLQKIANKDFSRLMWVALLGGVTLYIGLMGRSWGMSNAGFSETDVTLTLVPTAVMSMIVALLGGRLADHIGHRPVMLTGYVSGFGGLCLLPAASALWHFTLAYMLASVMFMLLISAGRALVGNVTPEQSSGSGLAFYSMAQYAGAAIGFAVTGAIGKSNVNAAVLPAILLQAISIYLLFKIRPKPSGKAESSSTDH